MKTSSETGLTLIELLSGVIIVGVIGTIIFSALFRAGGGSGSAQENLNAYAQQAGLQPINCVDRDTDGDGYVSCTTKDSKGNLIALQCSNGWLNSGCRLQPAVPSGARWE